MDDHRYRAPADLSLLGEYAAVRALASSSKRRGGPPRRAMTQCARDAPDAGESAQFERAAARLESLQERDRAVLGFVYVMHGHEWRASPGAPAEIARKFGNLDDEEGGSWSTEEIGLMLWECAEAAYEGRHPDPNGAIMRRYSPSATLRRVYFVRSGDGPVKIGVADQPKLRVAELQVGNPEKLSLLATMEGDDVLEKMIHTRFWHLRIRGEWFRADADLLAFIKCLQ